jgi:hypothetical protein
VNPCRRARCPTVAHDSLRSAASVFAHNGKSCSTRVKKYKDSKDTKKKKKKNSEKSDDNEKGNRRLLTSEMAALDDVSRGASAGNVWVEQVAARGSGDFNVGAGTSRRSLLDDDGGEETISVEAEFGPKRDRADLGRSDVVHAATVANLRRFGWLGSFEPLRTACPLIGRRIAEEAVSEFAHAAWACDGLGYAWECLTVG